MTHHCMSEGKNNNNNKHSSKTLNNKYSKHERPAISRSIFTKKASFLKLSYAIIYVTDECS